MRKFLRRHFERLRHFVVHGILGVHDSPHRIALGVAIGIFVAWLPLIGFQMGLAVIFATLFRANKAVGIPIVWISNPATLWLYIPNYLLGCWLLQEEPSVNRLTHALAQAFGANGNGLRDRAIILFQTLWEVFAPLMLGSVIIGAVLGTLCYAVTYRGVLAYHRWRRQAAPREEDALVEPDAPKVLAAKADDLTHLGVMADGTGIELRASAENEILSANNDCSTPSQEPRDASEA